MVEEQLMARGIRDPRVLDAMGAVPRHRFVDAALAARAYGDHALPTAEGQTISQPWIVAHMLELAEIEPVVPPYNAGESFDGWIVLPVLASVTALKLFGSGFEARARLQLRASVYFVG